jgi:hypothetical protein
MGKWLIALSWFVIPAIIIAILWSFGFAEFGYEDNSQERQQYIELAMEYEEAAAEYYKIFEKFSRTARSIRGEWMSTDQQIDYERYSRAADIAWDKYDECRKLAEQYRSMADNLR